MRHIVNLHPDLIKLDISLTRNIDTDHSRRALAKALITFARDIGSFISAEGVERAGELEMLRRLGVDKAQGFYLSRPVPLEEALRVQPLDVHLAITA
jgi:EAL domain-containing protein (putative c-di-GMP-specific phosphodiesterase class I)